MHIRNPLPTLQRVGLQAGPGTLPLLQLVLLAGCASFSAQPVAESTPPVVSETRDTLSLAKAQVHSMMEAVGKATAASRKQDYGATVRYLELAESIAPGHPQLLEQIARFRLRVGDTAGTLSALQRLAQVGRRPALDADSTYAALHSYPEFLAAAGISRKAARTVVASDTAFLGEEPDLLVEAIAHERLPGGILRVYVGSMATGRILTFDASAAGPTAVTEFVRVRRACSPSSDASGRCVAQPMP